MSYEYEVIVNRYAHVHVYKRYADGRLRFWVYVDWPAYGRVADALTWAVEHFRDAPLTIKGRN